MSGRFRIGLTPGTQVGIKRVRRSTGKQNPQQGSNRWYITKMMTELSYIAGAKSSRSIVGNVTARIRDAVTVQHTPQGKFGVKVLGHRRYVGGHWEEIGRLQFDFLVSEGLKSSDVLVDVACGCLRAGVHFIPYLEPGNYLGIEKETELIRNGLEVELSEHVREERRPEVIVHRRSNFDRFSKHPTFGIAQSLFTHLPPALITDCFVKLRLASLGWVPLLCNVV